MKEITADVSIIGGGICGCAIAREAALSGMKTVLLEKNDYASGTTSKSTRLVHGGLRYLAYGEFSLVRESLREQALLQKLYGPLVSLKSFLIPIYHSFLRRPMQSYPTALAGLSLYDLLSVGSKRPWFQSLSVQGVLEKIPILKAEGLRGGLQTYDCASEPEWIALRNIQDARRHGAACFNHCEVKKVSSIRQGPYRFKIETDAFNISSRAVVNASGPWVDRVNRLFSSRAPSFLRTTRGSHLILDPPLPLSQPLIFLRPSRKVFFMIPWRGATMIGTTDVDDASDPSHVIAEEVEVMGMWKELQGLLSPQFSMPSTRVLTYAGLRPLQRKEGSPENVTRRHKIVNHRHWGYGGWFSVVGSKIGVFRSMSERTIGKVFRFLKGKDAEGKSLKRGLTSVLPLYHSLESSFPLLEDWKKEGFVMNEGVNKYGREIEGVLECAKEAGGEKYSKDAFLRGETLYHIKETGARKLEDIMLRRITQGLTGDYGQGVLDSVTEVMKAFYGWGEGEAREEKEEYLREMKKSFRVFDF